MKTYAKINLGLNIMDQRPDGYHNIETIFIPVNINDIIEVEEQSGGIIIDTQDHIIPKDEKNICYKAAMLLKNVFKIESGMIIDIIKKIPVGAGLGGGSSNAAGTLIEIMRYFGLDIPQAQLNSLALQLGSDVPFFLRPEIAYAKGRGENLEYLNLLIPYWILVVFPKISISTKWAYENFIEKKDPYLLNYKEIFLENINYPDKIKNLIKNDFEEIVFKRYAGLINIKNLLYEKGAVYSSLSGSGSSIYGFFDSKINLERAINSLTMFKIFITNPEFKVPKEEYLISIGAK